METNGGLRFANPPYELRAFVWGRRFRRHRWAARALWISESWATCAPLWRLGAIRPKEVWTPRGLNAISVLSGPSGAGRSCHSGRASALTLVKASIPAFV